VIAEASPDAGRDELRTRVEALEIEVEQVHRP
jgi:hypothetical protein